MSALALSTVMLHRHFYRCPDCLTVVAVEYEGKHARPFECGVCSYQMVEHMGMVHDNRLVQMQHRSACDHKCTGARGPKCDCLCNGHNHGTGAVVSYFEDRGPIPVLGVLDESKAQQALENRAEYVQLRDEVRAAAKAVRDAHPGWMPEAAYRTHLAGTRALSDARTAKTHAGRMRQLHKARTILTGEGAP